MAASYVSEIGDALGGEGVENTNGAHVKILSPKYYQRTDNGVVSNVSIQDAIDGLASPKVKYKTTIIQHTVTASDVTQDECPFSDPIAMPDSYGNRCVAIVNLTGTILTSDTSAVTNSCIVNLDYNSERSFGVQTYATNFITQNDVQVNFAASTQLTLTIGSQHPSGLYLDIWRHNWPADSVVRVTAQVTVMDRE